MTSGLAEGLDIVVLAGGLTHEREVSIRSGRRVTHALEQHGATVRLLDLDSSLLTELSDQRPDLVWPVIHGSVGEDGSVQDFLSVLDLPFVGSRSDGARLASHKDVAKPVLRGAELNAPRAVSLPSSLVREVGARALLERIAESFGFPLIVKPAVGGSALGVSRVKTAEELPRALVACFAYGGNALIETVVEGTEIAASVIDTGDGPHCLPLVEIVTDGAYDFDARYNPGRSQYFVPSRLPQDVAQRVADTAVAIHTALGLRDLSRSDIIVDAGGTPWVLDTNIAPGLTEVSLLPQAVAASSFELGDLYASLARQAAGRS